MTRPTNITADREKKQLFISWDDGHKSAYSFDGLRAVCPCVGCKGGHAHMGAPPDPRIVHDAPITGLSLDQVSAVGSYAIQFFWTDGHNTGIYTWDMLRQACPCDICLPE